MTSIGIPELTIVAIVFLSVAVVMWPAARICRRVGYPRWLGVLAAVPIANVLLLWYVALAEWPLTKGGR